MGGGYDTTWLEPWRVTAPTIERGPRSERSAIGGLAAVAVLLLLWLLLSGVRAASRH
jgi:hypothetical protein